MKIKSLTPNGTLLAAVLLALHATGCFPLHVTNYQIMDLARIQRWDIWLQDMEPASAGKVRIIISADEELPVGSMARIDSVRFGQNGILWKAVTAENALQPKRDSIVVVLGRPIDIHREYKVIVDISMKGPNQEFPEPKSIEMKSHNFRRVWTLVDYLTY